jgi:hypothetical protein
MSRVHGRNSSWSTGFIKPWPSALGSTDEIKTRMGHLLDLIYIVDHGADGGPVSSLFDNTDETGDGRNSMAAG